MKTLIVCLLATLVLLSITSGVSAAEAGGKVKKGRGRLLHVVSFKFKEGSGAEGIRKVEEAFAALPGKIPQIASYEAGTNVSPEKLDKGFTHAFVLTFHSAKDRDDYLVHPDHKEFGKIVGPVVADVFVIDFWTEKAPKAGGAGKVGGKKAKASKE